MGRATYSMARKRSRRSRRRWLLTALCAAMACGMLCLLVLVPAGVRALPGRYAARLPEFLQDLRHRPHPELLPTPAVAVAPLVLPTPTSSSPRLSGVSYVTVTSQPIPVQSTPMDESSPTREPTTQPSPSPTSRTTDALVERQPSKTATSTLERTETPIPTPTSTPTVAPPSPTPPILTLPLSATLPPITQTYQTWNNCGPATLNMALYYYDQVGTQGDVALFLKPDPEDKNVSPHEMAAYARTLGLEATVRFGGDLTVLKTLIAAGFPVIVETWFIPEPGDQMGHYRLLTGFDDNARQFTAQDSYNGPNVHLHYDSFDELWRVFNRVYLVIYRDDQADELSAILRDAMDDITMFARALETAQAEATNPSDDCVAYEDCADGTAFAWFNMGSSLSGLGRHADAAAAYDQARVLGLPWRMLWYQFGPYESYYSVNRFEDVITLATVTLNVVNNLEESYYWRGLANLAQGDATRARADFRSAVKYNPNFTAAKEALESLD